MRWLIKADFPAAEQQKRRLDSPIFHLSRRAAYAFGLQRFHQRRQVVAHEIENRPQEPASAVELTSLAIGGVNAGLGSGQSED
jgi:hypothetical protein